MMWRSEGAYSFAHVAAPQNASDGMDCDYFERFVFAERRKNRRHSSGEHCLPSARRSNQKRVVPTSGGHFERALSCLLTDNVREVSYFLACVPRASDIGSRRQSPSTQFAN
jgi:hypothetical protein